MPARSLQCAGFALFHSYVWFRNGLLSFISPELFCTLLLCAHEGIFLEGSEGFQCCHCRAALSSTTGTGAGSDGWNVIRGNQEGVPLSPRAGRDAAVHQMCLGDQHCNQPTQLGTEGQDCICACRSGWTTAGSCFSFRTLHKTRKVKMLSGSIFWSSDILITQWLKIFKK